MKPYFETDLCRCGCGKKAPVSTYTRRIEGRFKGKAIKYINGHNLRGKMFSKKHKAKIGLAQKKSWFGNKRKRIPITYHGKICKSCKNIFFIKSSIKTMKYCSQNCFVRQQSKQMEGEKNPMFGQSGLLSPNWMGGLSFNPYPVAFNKNHKKTIREIDNNVCQVCENTEKKKLDVHHIDYNKKNLTIENLISLCKSCHMRTNYNRSCWKTYFKGRLNVA